MLIFSKLFRIASSLMKVFQTKIIYQSKISLQSSYTINWRTEIRAIKTGRIVIGKGMHTKEGCSITSSSSLLIGNNVFFNRNCIVACRSDIKIGNGCAFGPNVCVYDHDHRFGSKGMIPGEYEYGHVIIGNNCWIGAGAIILKGSTIGNNCVIGAGTIVKGNVPDNSLAISENSLRIKDLH